MRSVLHLLPHPGGGGETYIDLLDGMPGHRHERLALAAGRGGARSAPSLAAGYGRLLRRARAADVVHAHGDMASVLALPVLRGRPAVWTTHGLSLLRRTAGARGAVAGRAVAGAIAGTACTICTSEGERDELRALAGGRAERLLLVHNGIPPVAATLAAERAAARAELGLADGDVAVLYAGDLSPNKRILDAVAAVGAAREAGAPLVLLAAGEGPLRAEAERRAVDGVRLLGHRADLPRLLAAADVFLSPSEREGLSFAVLEAMGHRLAMVVSDGPGNAEAVGDAGIVVPVGDVAGLAGALGRLAADPAERDRLGAAAHARVTSTFTVERLRAGVAAAYERALRR